MEEEVSFSWVDIVVEDERWRQISGLHALIANVVSESLIAADLPPHSHCVTVGLFADKDVQALNREFRGKDTATNVLSFPSAFQPYADSGDDIPMFLGDIALGYETVSTEAEAEAKPLPHHIAHLVVHGVLHLAGFDHNNDEDAEEMENAERAILVKFGIIDPYRGADQAADHSALSSH